ncbi:MAG: hypothetical protein EZS28_000664 [Streblomastix strix]|uniref:Uncharacterized protein n=1 Tax=Streblomastix strix TaxID=222440 RepID=A0A5J4X9K7_9EUKA|nr:MAG: hypothetical protein EZS28_000664 [Streblomastix strix]
MESADSITLELLRQIGCQIDKSITSCEGLSSELFCHCCAVALNHINSELGLPTDLQKSGLKQWSLWAKLSDAMIKVGFKDECRPSDFNEPSALDARKFFNFLLTKQPRAEKVESRVESKNQLMFQIKSVILREFRRPWEPPNIQGNNPINYKEEHFNKPFPSLSPQNEAKYWNMVNSKYPKIKDNMKEQAKTVVQRALADAGFKNLFDRTNDTIPLGIIQMMKGGKSKWKQSQKLKGSKKGEQDKDQKQDENEEDGKYNEKEEDDISILNRLRQEAEETLQTLIKAAEQLNQQRERIKEMTENVDIREMEKQIGLKESKMLQLLVQMLPNYEESLETLKELNQKISERIKKLGNGFEKERGEYVKEFRRMWESRKGERGRVQTLEEQLNNVREQMQSLTEDAKSKISQIEELRDLEKDMDEKNQQQSSSSQSEKDSEKKDKSHWKGSRKDYIEKIGEIYNSHNAQKKEIERISIEITSIAGEIKLSEEKLDRVFREVDELVYQAARQETKQSKEAMTKEGEKKDSFTKQTYQNVIEIHKNYNELLYIAQSSGRISNQSIDTQARIDEQKQSNTLTKKQKIEKELAEIIKSNEELETQLKQNQDEEEEGGEDNS